MPLGVVAALLTGLVTHEVVVRRLFSAPRLILTVATIGVAQLVGAGEILLPQLSGRLAPLSTFHTHLPVEFQVGPIVFNGDHVVVLATVPVLLAALGWFFARSDLGIAVRASAESADRALLLGIPVRRLSLLAWMLAAGLSGVGSLLAAPILGPQVGIALGPVQLLAPLVAAVVARMESLPVAVLAALGIGVFQQGLFWNYPQSSYVDVALFAVVLVALLLQRRRLARTDDGGLGDHVAVREFRPVPALLARLPEVRRARRGGAALLAAAVLLLPLGMSVPHRGLAAFMAVYGVIAVSLVVLTGWSGQLSLGQFAFVGLGAAVTASLLVHAHADLFLALPAAAVTGALAAVLVGVPALRIRGLFLAVTTLAFGVPVSTFLLNSAYFPELTPPTLSRPVLIERFRLDDPLVFYYFCLACLAVTLVLARNFRHSRAGRVVVAVRDNERGAAAYAVDPVRAKLTAFALSGALAGFAGGLYVVGLRGVPFSGFNPEQSLVVFTMVVIGGATSLPGALMGAVYVQGAQYFLTGAAQLLATGAGLLVLLLVVPGGLSQVAYLLRDRALRAVARRRGLSVPSLLERPDLPEPDGSAPAVEHADDALLTVTGVRASYGRNPVLFGVDLDVADGDVLALLGTNGAGKSTVLRVVAGLLRPDGGQVLFGGEDITRWDAPRRVRAGIVTMPGGRGVFPSLTVRENLRLAGWTTRDDPAFQAAVRERVRTLFPVLGEREHVLAGSLSGGEQQMLALAQALMCRPRLLLVDELSLGLAPSVVAELLGVLRQVHDEGVTVLLVEQSVNVATAVAGRAAFLEKGQVRFTGATTDLADRDDIVRAVFLRGDDRGDRPARRRRRAAGAARLEVVGLSRSFGGVRAVDDVDLTVHDGEIVGVIGSNGAGKTTLFDLVSGFVPTEAGRVLLDGRDLTRATAAERAYRGLGRTFQDARLFPSMTVREVLATALERHVEVRDPFASVFRVGAVVRSEEDVAWTVDELVELMNLGRYSEAFVSELSTGTRRIVELGAALAHSPAVLLLDEPSSGIAQREVEGLREVLLRVREHTGAALAVIEHDIPLVSSIADRMLCLHLGAVIAEGTPTRVLRDPAVVASYLGQDEAAIARSDLPAPRTGAARRRRVSSASPSAPAGRRRDG